MTVEERFWSKVLILGPDDCWPWQLYVNRDGYGSFRINDKLHRAHRVAFKLANPDVDIEDFCVLHSCDFPPCCNPVHLRKGTQAENIKEMGVKGRARHHTGADHHLRRHPETILRGEDCPNRKLTEDSVTYIRSTYADGSESTLSLAARFGVCPTSVRNVVSKKTWRHLLKDAA